MRSTPADFPTWRDVDQDQGAERRRRSVIGLRDQSEQAAHRGTDQDRQCGSWRPRSASRQQGQIIDELPKIILAVVAPVAVAMAARIGGQATPALASQRCRTAVPGVSRLAEAMGKYQAAAPVHRRVLPRPIADRRRACRSTALAAIVVLHPGVSTATIRMSMVGYVRAVNARDGLLQRSAGGASPGSHQSLPCRHAAGRRKNSNARA